MNIGAGSAPGWSPRDADKASQAARDILYFMQGEVARIMPRARPGSASGTPLPTVAAPTKKRAVNRR